MIKFLIIFFILLLGVHEALLQEDSKIYLWSVVIFTFLSFLIYMLWYFTYYRQYIRNMKRLAEELEYLETHRIIPLLKENSGEILKEKTLEDGRKIFLFNVQDNLFGGLMRYGDGGGIYNRLKEQSSMFNLSIAPRDKEYSSTFVVWDEKNEENSDLKILKEFVSNLCKKLFNTEFSADVFDAVKTLFFHLNICIAGLLGRSGKNKISLLLGDLYDIVREIELATDKTELAIKDDITWFNFRMNLTGHYQSGKPDSSFEEYWSKIRPRNIAGDIIEQLKQIQGAKDVLLVHYPALWSDLAEPVNRYFYEKRNELRLYTADMQLDIKKAVPICQNGRYTIVEGEKLYQERIFDAILCFNLMQHCTKAKSKAYYRKFSGLLCDDGLLMILAAISRDPEVDTFSAERIADRTMMYLDNKISLRNNIFYLATDQGKFPLLLQELDCNDGKKSSLAKKSSIPPGRSIRKICPAAAC